MDSVTHVAGPEITIGDRLIQRCLVCGQKLIDSDDVDAPTGSKQRVWPHGRMIRTDAGRQILLPNEYELPEDSCIDLVE